jgi:hypothetical protein
MSVASTSSCQLLCCLVSGPVTRHYGLGADNVVSFRIVLADGRVVNASSTENQGLFSAMLGGGQSSFGIISSITVKTFPSKPVFRIVGHFERPQTIEEVPNVLTQFFFNATWVESLPTTLGMYLESLGSIIGQTHFALDALYIGDNSTELETWFGPLFASPFFIPGTYGSDTYANLAVFAVAAFGTGSNAYSRKYSTNVLVPPNQEELDVSAALIALAPQPACFIW